MKRSRLSPETLKDSRSSPVLSRRGLLGGAGATGAALLGGAQVAAGGRTAAAQVGELARHQRAFEIRVRAAETVNKPPLAGIPRVLDEDRYPAGWANFTKGLPHDERGEVNPFAYAALRQAIAGGEPAAFEQVPMGGVLRLKNPLAGLAFDLIGPDPPALRLPEPPAFASTTTAAEMVELYWQAMARDIPFSAYEDDPIVAQAAADLATLTDFRGPKSGGTVTPGSLFRTAIPGVATGPFVSQFLLRDLPLGPRVVDQRFRTAVPLDYLTTIDEWLTIQNGDQTPPAAAPIFDPTPRYVRNGRDLAEAVHFDWPGQSALFALLIAFGAAGEPSRALIAHGASIPLDRSNPYLASRTQDGFVTFDVVHASYLVAASASSALKAAWYQKWFAYRRLRPEAFGMRVHQVATAGADYPIHADLLSRSAVLPLVAERFGTTLLPQAYPEGSPAHPAYPAGHATWVGAAVTMLKAFLDESAVIGDPVVASRDGLALEPYAGPDGDRLTIGGDLNKLAWNVAVGRNFAGIHYRSDADEGLRLGETVAIAILRDLRLTYPEAFAGFTFTTFDGTELTV